MHILIIGDGAAAHACGEMLKRSPLQPQLFMAPGNVGCGAVGEVLEDELDTAKVTDLARAHKVDMVLSPSQPLAAGLAAELQELCIASVGLLQETAPSAEAGQTYGLWDGKRWYALPQGQRKEGQRQDHWWTFSLKSSSSAAAVQSKLQGLYPDQPAFITVAKTGDVAMGWPPEIWALLPALLANDFLQIVIAMRYQALADTSPQWASGAVAGAFWRGVGGSLHGLGAPLKANDVWLWHHKTRWAGRQIVAGPEGGLFLCSRATTLREAKHVLQDARSSIQGLEDLPTALESAKIADTQLTRFKQTG